MTVARLLPEHDAGSNDDEGQTVRTMQVEQGALSGNLAAAVDVAPIRSRIGVGGIVNGAVGVPVSCIERGDRGHIDQPAHGADAFGTNTDGAVANGSASATASHHPMTSRPSSAAARPADVPRRAA